MDFYRALLRLYPSGFRAEYGDELCRVHAERVRALDGPLAFPARATIALADVVPNALAAHFEILAQDVTFSLRALARTPAFALTAILVVALGVGANTAVFSLADDVFVRALPFRDPARLVKLWEHTPGEGRNEVSPANYRDWRALSPSFSDAAATTARSANLVSGAEPREIQVALATPNLFGLLGVAAARGRTFAADESDAIILSDGLWRSHFGGDPRVLGATVRLNDKPYTVAGVMPPSFRYPDPAIEAWTPLVFHEDSFQDRTNTYLQVVARLRPGVRLARARRDMDLVSARLARTYPDNRQLTAWVIGLRDEIPRQSRLLVLALCGAALCILLLACANLASLFLARGMHRQQELAVRAALGAGRERLVRQLVTESFGVALAGGMAGVVAAAAGLPLLSRLVPPGLPLAAPPSIDWRVLLFAAGVVLATGFGCGLLPALRSSQSPLAALGGGMRSTRAGTQRLRAGLIVIEVAASVVLLVTSGLLIRTIWRLQAVDPGFAPAPVLAVRTALVTDRYLRVAERAQFYERVLGQVRALPGVVSAAYIGGLPMLRRGGIWPATVAGELPVRGPANDVAMRFVTPHYFATLGIPLRRGRDVDATDTRGRLPVAVVSESFARRHWPGHDALGRRFQLAGEDREIVGIVGDVRMRGLEQSCEPQVYLPAGQVGDSSIVGYVPRDLVVRVAGRLDVAGLTAAIRTIVRAADPAQPISHVERLEDVVHDETAPRRTQLWLLGALAAIALAIAGLGVHGLLAFTVAMRERELGIRRALGAGLADVTGLVLREGCMLAASGIGIGLACGFAAARGMGALLVGVPPWDPVTLAGAAAVCFATALLGCALPAMRAARVDPMTALRSE